MVYHVLYRGNGRAEVFHNVEDAASFRAAEDAAAFLASMAKASVLLPMQLIAYCLMPNRFHLVLRPHDAGDLSRWMHWLLTTHVRRLLRHDHHTGPV